MPLYDYVCLDCLAQFEELVSSDKVKAVCPDCRSRDTEKKMPTSFGISFNAPGFYDTDYKRRDRQQKTLDNIKKQKRK